ncbi:hypothetical protein BDD43_6052 [Mucilaginibacter gracilis]|uniref:Lipoprotein n=1 Tax=Mucilaginibacter gracilis TaxID=423350 RepID=A0A495J9S3_9SPHI|nr:hypothetical protein [Mucilaginibacter gracilis]RKR85776.1 hypothetical protein BDD43_6052 [Mucilaginibacter gracilis]
MKTSKTQLAGLVLITGITMAAAFGCHKVTEKPGNKGYQTPNVMDNSGDTTGRTGDQGGPQFPPHGNSSMLRLTTNGDSTGAGGSGDQGGPQFPPH